MGIEQKAGNLGIVTHRLEDLVNWVEPTPCGQFCSVWHVAPSK